MRCLTRRLAGYRKSSKDIYPTCISSSPSPPKSATSLECLPNILLREIIDLLNQIELLSLCRVNSRFYSLCMIKLYKRVIVNNSDYKTMLNSEMITDGYLNFTVVCNLLRTPHSRFQHIINLSNDSYKNKHDYVIPIENYKKPSNLNEQINQRLYHMLKINLKDNSLSYKIAKKNSKNFSLFKKVELSSICTSLEALEQLKGIFVGVTSLSLDPIHLSETTLYPVVSIFCSQNIREVEIKNCCTLQKEDSLFKLFKAMPNIRVLVLQSSDSHVPAMVNFAILNLPNYSLQKFSLDMETPVPASELKEQLALVRTMVQYWGSTLELIRIHRVRPQEKVSLLTVDLFHYQQYYTKKEFDEEISRLISHLLQYQKLKTFVFYDNQYLRKHRQDWIRWTDLSIKK